LLLATYFDRRQPRWREQEPNDAAAADGGRPSRGSKMTEKEAYQILGMQPRATAQEITRAHRFLIKKFHPDQGGSAYLAAQINDAKDILLRRRR
jgi:DnaJ-domain-containing protein 1